MKKILYTLNAWLDWFKEPDESIPPPLFDGDTEIGYRSHGFASNRFICRFETEKVKFDVSMLMNDKPGEEDAEAIVKLALISLDTPFTEQVQVEILDQFANYNGGTLEDFLAQIDRVGVGTAESAEGCQIIYP